MADSAVVVTAGTGTNIDTRTEGTNGNHRQVIVIGDPATNAGVAPVDATNGLAVDVKASALPTGAATAANQQTDALTDTELRASAVPVSIATVPSHAVTNAGTFVIQENGAALTALQLIDDTVYTDGSGTPSKAIAIAGTDGTNPQIVKTDSSGELQIDVLSSALPSGAATSAKQDTVIGHLDGVETLLGTIDTDTSNISTKIDSLVTGQLPDGHNVTIDNPGDIGGGTQYTEGDTDATITGTAALVEGAANALAVLTQPLTDTQLRATAVPVSGTVAVTQSGTWDEVGINDSGNSITVDAANLDIRDLVNTDVVTAELSAVDNAVLDTIAAKDFATQTTLAAMNAKMVTGTDIGDVTINNASGAAAVNIQDGGNVITVDGTVAVTQSGTWDEVGINDSGNVITVDGSGTAGTAASGVVSVQGIASMTPIQVGDNSSSLTVDYATTGSGTATGALRVELPTNGTGVIATVGAVTAITNALPAGTNAIGKLAANSGVDIGDTDVTSVVPGTGATNLGKAEDGAHTSADVGVMALGVRTDVPNAAGAGTTGDYSFVATDMAGGIRTALYETDFAVLGTNHVKKYYTNAGAVTDGIIWSPAAGKRWYVTDIVLQTSAAATITLEDDKAGGDEVVWKGEIAANGGYQQSFRTPLFSGEDAADLMITTSAGNVYVTVTGYEI